MNTFKYKKVNAFTSEISKGNPAAYLVVEGEPLSPEQMLEIGRDHAGFVSEVVFCEKTAAADVKLTYYSSECEVEFCGHGTIAAMYDLVKNTPALRAKSEIAIETNKKGLLTVYNSLADENAVYITAPAPEFLTLPVTRQQAASALGMAEGDLDGAYPLDFIDAGLRTLIVPVKELSKEISIYPDEAALKKFCEQNGISIILAFSMDTDGADALAHTRVFAPRFGYLEDPATGSGNSAFANYALKNRLWDGTAAYVEQGGDNIAFNKVYLKTLDGSVLFGGSATTVIDGQYYL